MQFLYFYKFDCINFIYNSVMLIQQKILNHYTLIEKIGKPKSPHIFTAIVRSQTNEYFIAKKYSCNSQDIKNQIKKVKILHHPNILQIKDVVIQGNFVYIIEQYCQEGDLGYHIRRQIKKNKGPYDQKIVAKWLLQTLLAIQIFHNNHKLHLNIQPKNIYLTSNGNLKLNQKGLFSQVFNSLSDSPKKFKTQEERQRYFQLQSKKDIFSFGQLIYSLCHLRKIISSSNIKKQISKISKQVQDIFWSYSKPLNIIYFACTKKSLNDRPSAKQILKTSYFLQTMRQFIIDKKLNVSIFTRVPIKKYTVHKAASQNESLKQRLKANKENNKLNRKSVDKLPKIQAQNQNMQTPPNIFKKASRQKKQISQSKHSAIQRSSTEKRRKYSQDMKKSSRQKKQLPQILTPKPTPKKQKSMMMPPPPTLPKSKKQVIQTQKVSRQTKQIVYQQKTQNIFKKKQTNQYQNQNQNVNLNQTLKIKKKQEDQQKIEQLKKISESLSKIFQDLKIREDDQEELELSLELEDEQNQQLRLTLNLDENKDDLMKTYQFKFSEFVRQLKQKYYPDMETIIQKTHQFDSNDLYMNRQLIRKMSQMQLNEMTSNEFIDIGMDMDVDQNQFNNASSQKQQETTNNT